jgi:hypothetical protein
MQQHILVLDNMVLKYKNQHVISTAEKCCALLDEEQQL